jgi:hypothetical protein
MMSEEYNGSTNRITWLLKESNFYDCEFVRSVLNDQIIPEDILGDPYAEQSIKSIGLHKLAEILLSEWMRENFDDFLKRDVARDEIISKFIRDLIDVNNIDWQQLAASYDELIKECVKEIATK